MSAPALLRVALLAAAAVAMMVTHTKLAALAFILVVLGLFVQAVFRSSDGTASSL